jgi:VIT1/CCC1 family predicted Fe2+/Mn2+ transporter
LYGGIVTSFSFLIFGLLPIIPYIIGAGIIHDETKQHTLAALIIGGIELFSLGFAKAMLIDLNLQNKLFNGF